MIPKEFALDGRVAIVTGASQGIGKAIAVTLAEAGADIVAVARGSSPDSIIALNNMPADVQRFGRKCLIVRANVTNAEQVDNIVEEAISQFGKVDILVNNVGTAIAKPLIPLRDFRPRGAESIPGFDLPTSDEEWHDLMDTNVTSAFIFCRSVGAHMISRRSGKIINISSIEGARGAPYHILYTTSKAALNMFTRSLALEWARYNINVNAIGPGFFKTPMTAPDHEDPQRREMLIKSIPMRRIPDLREIGLLAVYLASDASNYMTGQVLYVDGGITAGVG